MAEAYGAIQGKVTDVSGAAVLGAVITIEGADRNRRTTVTDENGTFQISSFAAGELQEGASTGKTVSFVLAQDLSVDGKVLAKTADIARDRWLK